MKKQREDLKINIIYTKTLNNIKRIEDFIFKKGKSYTIIIPRILIDQLNLIKKHYKTDNDSISVENDKTFQKLVVMLSYIYFSNVFKRRKKEKVAKNLTHHYSDYVNIKSSFWYILLSTDKKTVSSLKNFLVSSELIFIDNYIPMEKSIGYRISNDYDSCLDGFYYFDITDSRLIDKINRFFESEFENYLNDKSISKTYKHLHDNLDKLAINKDKLWDDFKCGDLPQIEIKDKINNRELTRKYRDVTKHEIEDFIKIVERNDHGRRRKGRYYHKLTSVRKLFRAYIIDKIDNSPLEYEIDISNIQPLLLANVIDNHRYFKIKNLNKFNKYREYCEQGKLYEMLASYNKQSVEEAKSNFYKFILYAKSNKSKRRQRMKSKNSNNLDKWAELQSNYIEMVDEHFPDVGNFLRYYKKKKSNKELQKVLTLFESDFMITRLCSKLESMDTFYTIHDALFCKKKDVEFVKEQIKETAKSFCLENIPIKIKQLNGSKSIEKESLEIN